LHKKYSNLIKGTEDGKIFPRKDAKAQRKTLRNAAALRAFAPLREKFFHPPDFSCKPYSIGRSTTGQIGHKWPKTDSCAFVWNKPEEECAGPTEIRGCVASFVEDVINMLHADTFRKRIAGHERTTV
jgi:hypothetical protein